MWAGDNTLLYVSPLMNHHPKTPGLIELAHAHATDKTRSLEFEETFFSAFERWFRMVPLLSRSSSTSTAAGAHSRASAHGSSASIPPASPSLAPPTNGDSLASQKPQWGTHGQENDVYTYICHRRADTLPSSLEAGSKGWWTPETDEEAMRGPVRHESSSASAASLESVSMDEGAEALGSCRTQEREVDHSWGWAEAQLAAIEWD